jgi:hypothetical protein
LNARRRTAPSRRARMLLLGVFCLGVAAACRPAPPPATVIFYGDSLSQQSTSHIDSTVRSLRPGWRPVFRNHGGTAICDWLDDMRNDGDENARVVVIQFSGNSLTSCMTRPGASGMCSLGNYAACIPHGSQMWKDKYRADAAAAVSIWKPRGARILFVANPGGVCQAPPHALDATYQQVVAAHSAGYPLFFTTAPQQALTVTLEGKLDAPTTTTTTTLPQTTTTTQDPSVTTTTGPGATTTTADTTVTTGAAPDDPGTSQQAATSPDADPPEYGPGEAPEPVVQAATTWPCEQPDHDTSAFAFAMECYPDEKSRFSGSARQPACVHEVDDGGTPGDPSDDVDHWVIQVRDGTDETPGGHFCRDDAPAGSAELNSPSCAGYVAGIRRFGGAIASEAALLMY